MRLASAFVLGLVAVCFVSASTGAAPQQQEAFPWERKTNKLLQPKSIDRLDRARRVLDRDSRKLNLPKNRILGTGAAPVATPLPSGTTSHDRLDTDRDGFVSRNEYLTGRGRPVRAGAVGRARHGARRSRLDARFRAADRDRDGRLSTGELEGVGNRRF